MVSSHKARQERRAANLQPKNVSVIVDGITKVIPWKEYAKDFLQEEEAVVDPVEPKA